MTNTNPTLDEIQTAEQLVIYAEDGRYIIPGDYDLSVEQDDGSVTSRFTTTVSTEESEANDVAELLTEAWEEHRAVLALSEDTVIAHGAIESFGRKEPTEEEPIAFELSVARMSGEPSGN